MSAPKHTPRHKRFANRQKNIRRLALIEKLEVRETPAIALVGTELVVTGSSLNDAVAIGYGPHGSGQIVASNTASNSEGQTIESKAFPFASVATIRVTLGNGTNVFVNHTNIPSRVFGGTGSDIVTGGRGNDELFGLGGNDQLKGGDGNDRLEGSSGNDILEGGDGNDTMSGGEGNDTLRGDAGGDSMQGDGGDDLLLGGDGLDQARGNDGNDRLIGGADYDTLYGDAGDDTLEGEAGNDKLYGGIGLDKLVGGNDNDTLYGEADQDELYGGLGNDNIFGGDGNDELYGSAGDDELYGDAGNDLIEGGSGADAIYGGLGDDQLFGNVMASTDTSADSGNTIRGGSGDDWIFSSAGADTLFGESGKDRIQAGAGNDRIWGGLDDDNILAGNGNDEVYGDGGNDTIQGGQGNDSIEGGSGNDLLAANIILSDSFEPNMVVDDTDIAGNKIVGGSGNDRIFGSNQNDMLSGNDGDDWINAMAGNDEVYGGNGNDVLLGGSGVDKLDGGLNKDRIVSIDNDADTILPQSTATTIVERDELWLDLADYYANITAVMDVQIPHSDAVHVVGQYRTYDATATIQFTPTMNWGVSNLIDPDARAEHVDNDSLVKLDLGGSPLFGPDGPLWSDINQGSVGTCYFLARLAALAKTHPQHIRDMITELGDGTFVVKFLNQEGESVYVRVDGDLYSIDGLLYADRGAGAAMWVAIIEKAWAIHRYGYATYDSISGGNGVQNDDRTENAIALGIEDVKLYQNFLPTPQLFANSLKSMLDSGRGVVFGARAFISDTMPMVSANYRSGEHILMVHSVDTNAQGNVTKIRFYDLYGGPLKEMTNLEVFFYGCGAITAFKPLA